MKQIFKDTLTIVIASAVIIGGFDETKLRSLAKPDSKDAFEIYLKDFGKHSHAYRFQVTDGKPLRKQKK